MSADVRDSETQRLHFLVIEDDNNHAEIILRSLNRNELVASVDRVRNGEQALAYLRAEGGYSQRARPDVIVVDLKLPKIDGHEVLARIKHDADLRTIPAVVLSTSNAECDRAEAYRRGANSYLVKPANFVKFRELLDQLTMYWGTCNRPARPNAG